MYQPLLAGLGAKVGIFGKCENLINFQKLSKIAIFIFLIYSKLVFYPISRFCFFFNLLKESIKYSFISTG